MSVMTDVSILLVIPLLNPFNVKPPLGSTLKKNYRVYYKRGDLK